MNHATWSDRFDIPAVGELLFIIGKNGSGKDRGRASKHLLREYPDALIRTVKRRVKASRHYRAHEMIFGFEPEKTEKRSEITWG